MFKQLWIKSKFRKVYSKIFKSIKDNTPIKVYGDGLNVRDWIHVEDHRSSRFNL